MCNGCQSDVNSSQRQRSMVCGLPLWTPRMWRVGGHGRNRAVVMTNHRAIYYLPPRLAGEGQRGGDLHGIGSRQPPQLSPARGGLG
jgi:hypothetical protein